MQKQMVWKWIHTHWSFIKQLLYLQKEPKKKQKAEETFYTSTDSDLKTESTRTNAGWVLRQDVWRYVRGALVITV